MNKPTVAVLCIARNENPYTAEWLDYHISLGFDRVYFVSTDTDYGKVVKFFEEIESRSKVSLHHFDEFKPGWQMGCYNTFFPLVREDWVLIMDIDEYLYLNSYTEIQSFLESVADEIGQIQFPWLNLMSTGYCHQRTFDILSCSQKYVSDHVKSIVRSNCVTGLGVHSHGIRRSKTVLSSGMEVLRKDKHDIFLYDPAYYEHYPFILHFCSRGHFDVINRIVDHRFFNQKSGDLERRRLAQFLTAEPVWEHLPTRYLLMMFLQTLPTVTADISIPKLESNTDLLCLQGFFLHNIRAAVDFECTDPAIADKEFEDRYLLKYKLALLDLTGKCDCVEYLSFGSQLEYISRLRKRLQAPGSCHDA